MVKDLISAVREDVKNTRKTVRTRQEYLAQELERKFESIIAQCVKDVQESESIGQYAKSYFRLLGTQIKYGLCVASVALGPIK
ncbi:hypothetical protein HYX15_03060 [Candidatus Woesearchaeota archaeon]|nr:hypothetical protein [Candidatus Woesearchaeota archaeon]